jgi:hypothetical protein
MPKSIEILENTLLKLLVRSGSDSDRKTVILDSAELGYTTDTKRLYIGDGSTAGGILVGNVFKGSSTDVTTLGNSTIGDLAFDTDNKVLYQLKYSAYNNLSSWEQIGGVYSAADSTIKVSSTNTVSVCAISAYNISSNALGKSLTLDTGKVTLSSTISIDKIIPNTSTYFTLPSALSINTLNYTFPSTPLIANTFLSTNSAGNLSWVNVNTLVASVTSVGFASASATITVGQGLTAVANGVPSNTFKLSSSDVQIGGLFLPKAHATFDQTGAVQRSVGVVSVSAVNFAYITGVAQINSLFGFALRQTDSNLDYRGAAGYLITTTDNYNTTSTVIDVVAKNAAHSWTNNYYKYGEDPTLKPFYQMVGGPGPSNKILVFFYTIPIGAYGQPQGPVVTSGYANIAYTRFSVTVY